MNFLRRFLRSFDSWIDLRRVLRGGLRTFVLQQYYSQRILGTRPQATAAHSAPAECVVHMLTWDGDWINTIWAAKSFYYHTGVNWPLILQVGGRLKESRARRLMHHFPNARLLFPDEAHRLVEPQLRELGLMATIDIRRRSMMMFKLIDCRILTASPRLFLLDSDVLFFRRPDAILEAAGDRSTTAYFNRDIASCYNITDESAMQKFGTTPPPNINAGVAVILKDAIPLEEVEEFLSTPAVVSDPWLVEQTVHALAAGRYGVEMLPDTYLVSHHEGLQTESGEPVVCKHYVSYPRRLMYVEGMRHLIASGFPGCLR